MMSAVAVLLAFPAMHFLLQTVWWRTLIGCFLGGLLLIVCRAAFKKRWLSVGFHLGMMFVLIGGWITADYAKEQHLILTDCTYAPHEFRQCLVEGDRVMLHAFEIPTYPNGMPQQYRSHLIFPEGVRTVEVNAPLRRKGWTYYQMSYDCVAGFYGESVYRTMLVARKDPGVAVTFCGYLVLTLSALALAIRETLRRPRPTLTEENV